MCNHIYDHFIKTELPLQAIFEKYLDDGLDKKFLTDYYYRLKKERAFFDQIFIQPSSAIRFNKFLKKKSPPFLFEKQPRTGHALTLDLLKKKKKVFLFGFTIDSNETRESYGMTPDTSDQSPFHSKKEEVEIIKWLHNHQFIDLSLCLLDDQKSISFSQTKDLEISTTISQVLRTYYTC
jgi:hypothetical protein